MIEVKNLTKNYGSLKAVDNISFSLKSGEIVGFLGPNGAGKTTTMRILSGAMPQTSGSAKVADYDVFYNPNEVKKRIGYLPEHPPVYPDLTVYEYLKYAAVLKSIPPKEIKHQIYEVLQKVKIEDRKNQIIGNLSKGLTQRAGLAQALLGNSQVLILDEPTVGLDPIQIIDIRNLVKELSQDKTILLSSHILAEVNQICERVIIINAGKIVSEVSLNDLKSFRIEIENFSSIEEIIKTSQQFEEIKEIKNDSDISNVFEIVLNEGKVFPQELLKNFIEKNWNIIEFKKSSLEDIYINAVQEDNKNLDNLT